MPTLYIIAGPNGVGKTTFANNYLPNEARQLEFVNADLIARGLSPYNPDGAVVEAGRIALRRIRELIANGIGFTWETTMSGRSAVNWLAEAKKRGFSVKCYFLWVHRADITISRVKQRVLEGGHNIDPDVSRRRFLKTVHNFFEIYRPLMDSWRFYENEGLQPRLIAAGKGGRIAVRDPKVFGEIRDAVQFNV